MLLAAAVFSSADLYMYFSAGAQQKKAESQMRYIAETDMLTADRQKELYRKMKALDSRYLGWLVFEEGWISEPVVSAEDCSWWLDHSINGAYGQFGTVFADPSCTADSMNMTLYGHHVIDDPSLRFGRLCQLRDPLTYEAHDTFSLWLEQEVRRYQIVYVIEYDETSGTKIPFASPVFDEETFAEYTEYLKEHSLIDSGRDLSFGMKMMTLQTCRDMFSPVRILVIAAETDRHFF